jgi:hypothetical protein
MIVTYQFRRMVEQVVRAMVSRVDFTPSVTQGVGVTLTAYYSWYIRLGPLVIVASQLAITSAGTGGQPIVIGGLPPGAAPMNVTSDPVIGAAQIIDAGVGYYEGNLTVKSASEFRMIPHTGNYFGVIPNFALAANDVISFTGVYISG